MTLSRSFLFFVFYTCVLCGRSAAGELQLVSVIFRHGDRSPIYPLPNDLYPNSTWPQGFGQLSVKGMQQQYHLGSLLRERYIINNTFLAHNYTRVQIYVRSTDYDRTLMSAEAQLAALFPPGEDQIFDATIPWQPVPVHTVPQQEDNLLQAYDVHCPRYAELREADKHTQEYLQMQDENQDFFEELENKTGLYPVNLSNVWMIQDTLFVEHNGTGLDLPTWVEPGYMLKLKELSDFDASFDFNSREKIKLIAGLWLQKVLSHMMGKANWSSDLADAKVFLYSAHDTSVATMMSALGVYDGLQPEYASAFIIELLSDDDGNYYVQLLYRSFTDSDDITTLQVPSCANQSMCTLEEFKELVSPLIPDNWEEECRLTSKGSKSKDADVSIDPAQLACEALAATSVLASVFGLTVLVVFVYVCYKRCTKNHYKITRNQVNVQQYGQC